MTAQEEGRFAPDLLAQDSDGPYQPGARDRVARWYRDQWGYRVNNETTLRHADDALQAVRPELERLSGLVQNFRFLWNNAVKRADNLSGTVVQLHEKLREVSRLREQLAAQPKLPDETVLCDRIERAQSEWWHGENYTAAGHNEDPANCCWCYEAADVAAKTVHALLGGVSSSEVEAPQPQPLQHRVQIKRVFPGAWAAWCPDCRVGGLGTEEETRDWQDGHEADTLRLEPLEHDPEESVRAFLVDALNDEGRPSGSGRLAPRSEEDEVRALLIHPAAWTGLVQWLDSRGIYVQTAGDLEGIPCWSMGVRDLDPPNAAQAARSEATPRVWAEVDLQPCPEDVRQVRDCNGFAWRRLVNDQWITGHQGDGPCGWPYLIKKFGPLIEVPSPSLRKEGEDTPTPAVSSQEEKREGETDDR